MTEYQRYRGEMRWYQEQVELLALLNRFSLFRWGVAVTPIDGLPNHISIVRLA